MNNNVFEKIDKQSEQIADLAERQEQILSLLQQNASSTGAEKAALAGPLREENEKAAIRAFLRGAKKTYHYLGDEANYQNEKKKALVFLSLTILVAVIGNVLTTLAAGMFSTFSLVEDLWFFLAFRIVCHILHSKRFYDHVDYSNHSYENFAITDELLYYPAGTKKTYRIIKILALISAPCDIIYLAVFCRNVAMVFAIIFEVFIFVAVFISFHAAEGFFCQYSVVYYSGKTQNGTATIVFDHAARRWYSKEDYEKTFPFAK